jgi:hypothetical protein
MTVRGCGRRSYGGVYIEVRLAPPGMGMPVEAFLIDPVREVPDGLGIPHRGVALIQRPDGSGIYDVWDRVGTKHYANVEDFIMETKRHGISRKLSSKTDMSLLTRSSRLILVHERAMLLNADELYRSIDKEMGEMVDAHHWVCRHAPSIPDHDKYPLFARDSQDMMPTCISCWREIVRGGSELYDPTLPNRTVERTIGDTTYRARRAPVEFIPEFVEGIFGIFPISGLAVINDPQESKHIPNLEKARQSGLNVSLEEE